MRKEQKIQALGWFFLVLGLVSVLWHTTVWKWQYAFWFCNHAMVIVGLALLFRNRFWLTAMLNWSLIPVSIWTIDFLGKLVFGAYLFRVTEYMFVDPWWMHLLGFQHLFTVPLMLYALYLVGKPHPRAWLGTAAHGIVLWIISYFVITPDYNVNCSHESCVPMIVPNVSWYPALWILVAIVMFAVTNWFLVRVFRTISARAKHR